jgi:2-polyprenyl-6-methoxyphenol hydroxylase-like FAD-dependent oxidoreductase
MPLALIAGAGIGGLGAGLALRRAGWDVRIFERAPAPRAVGFGLALAPNAIAALHELGVADAVAAHAWAPSSAEIRGVDGRVLRRFIARPPVRGNGRVEPLRYAMILRAALHAVLLDALGPSAVEGNRTAARFTQDSARVRIEFEDGPPAEGDILIGADGLGSIVRSRLHPQEPPPFPSGYFAVRGASPSVDRLNGIHALIYLGPGVESGVLQASPDAVYWYLSLLASDIPAGTVKAEDVVRRFLPAFDAQFQAIVGATPPESARLDNLLSRQPLPRWGDGRVTLLGDAAHPMLPHTGQGAAQALEDAVALGRAFARATGDHVRALRTYEEARRGRTRRLVRMGPRLARMTTTRSLAITALRTAAIRIVPEGVMARLFTQPGAPPRAPAGA